MTSKKDSVAVRTVACADNGGCGPCNCQCHTDVDDPGPHIPSCKFADIDYVPPDFVDKVRAAINEGRN